PRPVSHTALHSLPTRRSSDLDDNRRGRGCNRSEGFNARDTAVFTRFINGSKLLFLFVFLLLAECTWQPNLIDGIRARALLFNGRSEEHTSELQSRVDLVCRLL